MSENQVLPDSGYNNDDDVPVNCETDIVSYNSGEDELWELEMDDSVIRALETLIKDNNL